MDPTLLSTDAGAANVTCFYHRGCPDGVGGAWTIYACFPLKTIELIRKGLENLYHADPIQQLCNGGPVFQGINHGDKLVSEDLVAGRDVIYVDIVSEWSVLRRVAELARSVTILDHHPTSKVAIHALNTESFRAVTMDVYDENRSGAQIAWDWAHEGRPRPAIIDYIGDRDLYRFLLPDSRAINETMFIERITSSFQAITDNADKITSQPFVERGRRYLTVKNANVMSIASRARVAWLTYCTPSGGKKVLCVLAVNSAVYPSELGEQMMLKAHSAVQAALIWEYSHDKDEIWVSMRTNRPEVDLSKITPHVVGAIRGGGHRASAGFTIPGDSISAVVRCVPTETATAE